jgi:predicted RNase H-like HicB family nuclease
VVSVDSSSYAEGVELTAAITHEGELFVARCLEVEVTSQGASAEDALESLKEALGLYFEDEGEPVDLAHPVVTTFQFSA